MLGIIIITGGEGVEAAGQPVDGRVEGEVIVVGEDDVEVPVQLGGGELVEMLGDEGDADEVSLGALWIFPLA